mgnify:CR=1 FL=1
MNKVLVVEDDAEIAQLLKTVLEQADYQVVVFFSGKTVLEEISTQHYDLILLDLMLPEIQGEDLLPQIREINQIPVIIVSAKGSLYSKIEMLQMGADDYIAKPFEPQEVLARMMAALRRYRGPNHEKILYDDFVIDDNAQKAFLQGQELILTGKEYAILKLLCSYPSKVFSKANLFESVWNEPYAYENNTLGAHISNLRKKLKEQTKKDYIETVWGIGYKIK